MHSQRWPSNFWRLSLIQESLLRSFFSCIFLLISWKALLSVGFAWFRSSGSSLLYTWWHDEGVQAAPSSLSFTKRRLRNDTMSAIALLPCAATSGFHHTPLVGEHSVSATSKFFNSENAQWRTWRQVGCGM